MSSSDDEFLRTMCRAPGRRPVSLTESDEEYAASMCRRPAQGAARLPADLRSVTSGQPASSNDQRTSVTLRSSAPGQLAMPPVGGSRNAASGQPVFQQPVVNEVARQRVLRESSALIRSAPVQPHITPPSASYVWPTPPAHLTLPGHNSVCWQLKKEQSFEEAVAYVLERIGVWVWSSGDTLEYKVGITWRPEHRWRNERYGYMHEDFRFMEVLVAVTAEGARRLERRMTDILMDTDWRCSNRAPGGGGVSSADTSLYYVYVVYKDMSNWDAMVLRRRLWKIRSREL
jgi:hypothetical protein